MTNDDYCAARAIDNGAADAPLLSLVYASQAVIGFDLRALDELRAESSVVLVPVRWYAG